MRFKRIIAKEGLILVVIAGVIYLITVFFCHNIPVVFPKYRAEFANGQAYTVEIYPEINYSKVFHPRAFLKEAHNPPPKLVSKRIAEFARRANINSALKKAEPINKIQLCLSEAYSGLMLQSLLIKTLFVYLFLIIIRFVFWAARTLS